MTQPIAVTLGDPAGIGPEIVNALISARAQNDILIIGDARIVDAPAIARYEDYAGGIAVLDMPCATLPIPGQPALENASAIKSWIETGANLAKTGKARALVTAPIAKDILIEGTDFPYPGHTEFLGAIDESARPVMMLACDELRVVPATIHCPLREVPDRLTAALLDETIEITAQALQDLGLFARPRIAVAGLNPHAGENGKLGHEEREWIADLIANKRAQGLDIEGPFPADTMFHERARAGYDVAICMYHDQALIPIKTLAFDRGVNVTLGLSFLRSSPDHGTAFDIAGKAIANPSSMIAAFDFADRYGAKT